MTSMLLFSCSVSEHVEVSNSVVGFTVFSCFCLHCRSDSDSEGENPEKKKLQEQLMGEWASMDSVTSHGREFILIYVCVQEHCSVYLCRDIKLS